MMRPILLHRFTLMLLSALAFLALWQAVAQMGLVKRSFLVGPVDAFAVLWRQTLNGSLVASMLATTHRMVTGFALASGIGILLGAALGSSALVRRLLMPTLDAIRPLPASAIIPVAILMFGLNEAMSVFVIAFGSMWPVLLGTVHGFQNVPVGLRELARVLEMGRLRAFLTVHLPSAFRDIFPGLRTGLALALIMTVVTEMQASLPGLGYDIFVAQRSYRSADLYAALMVIGVIGLCINQILVWAERRLFPWASSR